MKIDKKNRTTVSSRRTSFLGVLLCAGLTLALMVPAVAFSYNNPTAVALGHASTFGALAYSGITTAGVYTVNGDLGTATSVISPNITSNGGTKYSTGVSQVTNAQTDLGTALSNTSPLIADDPLVGNSLDGLTLHHGVYGGTVGTLVLTTALTLDGDGDPNAIFIIKASAILTIGSGSTVSLIHNAKWSNVFWYVGTSATIFDGTTFNGIVLAEQAITLNASATLVNAQLLAHGAAVTINSNVLPMELVSFTATAAGLNADLHWSTATEVHNYGFEIQRRQTADWAKVGFVAGAGTSNSPRDYSYTDNNLSPGRYTYRLKQIDNSGAFSYHGSVEVEIGSAPQTFALLQNYPNPFNPSTVISYQLPVNSQATLKVYNMLGQEVATLVNSPQEAGSYTVSFNANKGTLGLSSGVYIYRLKAGSFVSTKKLVLMK